MATEAANVRNLIKKPWAFIRVPLKGSRGVPITLLKEPYKGPRFLNRVPILRREKEFPGGGVRKSD